MLQAHIPRRAARHFAIRRKRRHAEALAGGAVNPSHFFCADNLHNRIVFHPASGRVTPALCSSETTEPDHRQSPTTDHFLRTYKTKRPPRCAGSHRTYWTRTSDHWAAALRPGTAVAATAPGYASHYKRSYTTSPMISPDDQPRPVGPNPACTSCTHIRDSRQGSESTAPTASGKAAAGWDFGIGATPSRKATPITNAQQCADVHHFADVIDWRSTTPDDRRQQAPLESYSSRECGTWDGPAREERFRPKGRSLAIA